MNEQKKNNFRIQFKNFVRTIGKNNTAKLRMLQKNNRRATNERQLPLIPLIR